MSEHPIQGWLRQQLLTLEQKADEAKTIAERAEERAAEAEREIINEARARRKSARQLITAPVAGFTRVPATLVRDWIRSELLPDIVPRLYDIAMGTETFDHVTAEGKIVQAHATAAVQVQAASALLNVGMARVPEEQDPNELPGVYALGELELSQLQRIDAGPQNGATNGHAVRGVLGDSAAHTTQAGEGAEATGEAAESEASEAAQLHNGAGHRANGGGPVRVLRTSEADDARSHRAGVEGRGTRDGQPHAGVSSMQFPERGAAARGVLGSPDVELEYVEVEEDATRPLDGHQPGEQPPPPPPPAPPTLAQEILARRRARRAAKGEPR